MEYHWEGTCTNGHNKNKDGTLNVIQTFQETHQP